MDLWISRFLYFLFSISVSGFMDFVFKPKQIKFCYQTSRNQHMFQQTCELVDTPSLVQVFDGTRLINDDQDLRRLLMHA
jgi:hypothetical protein